MKSKAQLRQVLNQKRKKLSAQAVAENSQAICQAISKHFFSNKTHFNYAIYLPFGNEVDLRSLLSTHPKGHIPSVFKNTMQFQPWFPNMAIEKHPLGMRQPPFITYLPPSPITLCFLPLLGFDCDGHRLGMGGGFYDRYFESNTNTQLIGVAHDCQEVERLPTDEWDVKLHAIVTESQIIKP